MNRINSCQVILMSAVPLQTQSLKPEAHWDYNAFVRNISGWPYSSLPNIPMQSNTLDVHLDEVGVVLSSLIEQVIIEKCYSEKITFDVRKSYMLSLQTKVLYEKKLKGYLEKIKNDPTNIRKSKICPTIGNRVWQAVETNSKRLVGGINYFLDRKLQPVRSFDEYEAFIGSSISLMNAIFSYCDSIITNIFQNLSTKYKEAKSSGKETTSIVKELDDLVDVYDQLVEVAMSFEEVLKGPIPKKKISSASSNAETIDLKESDKEMISPSVTKEVSVLQQLGITHLFVAKPINQQAVLSSTNKTSTSSSSYSSTKKTVTGSKDSSSSKNKKNEKQSPSTLPARWEEQFNDSFNAGQWNRHIKLRKLLRLMKKDGWKFLDKRRGKGSHIIADTPDGRRVTIPTSGGRGGSLKPGTFGSIHGRRNRK